MRLALSFGGLAALFALPFWLIPAIDPEGSGFWQHIFVTIFVFAAMACAWNILGGFAGQLSLGQTIFYGIGGYAGAMLNQHFGLIPWLGGIAGAAVSVAIAVAIAWPCLRLRGPFFTLSTIAFLEVIRLLAIHFKDFTGGSAGLPVPMFVGTEMRIGWAWMLFRDKENYLIIAFGLLVVCLAASWAVRNSRLGFYLVAVREREDAARAVGVNATAVKLAAFAISAGLTSLVGTFHGIYLNFIDPETMFSLPTAIQVAMFALIGGLGTVTGPIWGTLLVVPIAEAARGWLGAAANGLHGLVYGLVLVAVVLTMPKGLVGSIGPWLKRRLGGAAEADTAARIEAPEAAAPGEERPPVGEPLLEARNLTKRFGGLVATNDVSVTLREGEVLGVIGPNGAGKTTLFNLLSGFLAPSAGGVKVRLPDGSWVSPGSPHGFAAAGVARTFQIVQPFTGLSVRENIMLGAFHGTRSAVEARRIAEEVAATVGLTGLLDAEARSLTVGGAKRLEVARALAMKPRVLLLDEVMAGLNPADVQQAVELIKRVRDSGVSVIAIEHVMAAVMALSDHIVVINSGKLIAEGPPSEIARNPAVIEAYLGEEYAHAAA
ncbi:branched-chain amino acid ABC transporter ATP-binding protein/permease [Roseomonas eburnea]|uniref:Branched-chain amino acid ABC transporter ATP-binding protein/permease n=1 Tax=Neoroseomonas eburnea TaxID=1346889 RepID=A0A9X9XFS0_9PROT|nr:branched-chain amino acid ABC transporter ATP-binding protein/permease [Neoroseomonas eburnea]MBR0682556.1 branched-chain amino acid ABC transporter ATP-binding protein/permease [Neoroseomonas eburnea]